MRRGLLATRPLAQALLRLLAAERGGPRQPANPLAPGERGHEALLPSDSRGALRALPERTRLGRRPAQGALGARLHRGSYPRRSGRLLLPRLLQREHIYHPLVVFDGESGHLICTLLRAGNTHASNSSVAILKRIVSGLRGRWPEAEIEIRADAGFVVPALYDYCQAEGITYTVGLISNARLEGMAEDLLAKAKESHQRTAQKARLFSESPYGAASWEKRRRVVYKAEAMEKGTNTRFVLTTRTDGPKDLYEFYARRAESENWIKDLKVHMKADRLSCHRFIANQFSGSWCMPRLTG